MVWRFITSLRSLLSRGRAERELDEELAYHVEMETEANIQRGVPAGEARRLALISLGGAEQIRLEVRDVRRTVIDPTLEDVGYALRRMRREPGVAAATILTFAVTVGLAAAVYSVAQSVLFRPFPFDEPESLVAVWKAKDDIDFYPLPVPEMLDLKSRVSAVKDVGGFTREGFVLSGPKGPRWAEAFLVTTNLFDVLGVRAVRGRTFAAGDGVPGHDKVLVIGETLWREAFDADPGIIGREVSLRAEDSAPQLFQVVGVVAPDLQLFYPAPLRAELYVPRVLTTQDATEAARSVPSLITVARLQPGSTAAQATSEITAVMAALTREHPRVSLPGATARVLPLHEELVGRTRPVFTLLAGGALVFLLIGCANVTNLLLSTGLRRQRELATRVALGCSKPRLVRQLGTEQLALVLLGSMVGVCLSGWLTTVFKALAPEKWPRASEIQFHGEAVVVSFALAVFAWVLSGVLPAVWLSKDASAGNSSARASGRRRGRRLRSVLVLAESALMMGLLGAAALLANSLFTLDNVDIGFEAKGVFAAHVMLPERRATPQVSLQFEHSLLERLRQDDRIGGASITSELPFTWGVLDTIRTSDRERPLRALVASADEQYLQLLRVRLLRGRFFTSRDVGQPRVAIINEALASRLGSGEVIGRRILIEREWREIVGVVADVTEIGRLRAGLIRQSGLARLTLPAAYVPRGTRTTDNLFLVCRPGLDATGATELLRTHALAVNPEVTIRRGGWLEDRVRSAGADVRFCALLVAMFSAGGLMLAAIGLYGVVSHGVSQLTTEIGVRAALGATPRRIQWMVTGKLVAVVVVGALVGLAATLGAGSVLRAFLFEVPANDSRTLAAAAAGLLTVAALAAYLPARRAGRLDPVQALRSE